MMTGDHLPEINCLCMDLTTEMEVETFDDLGLSPVMFRVLEKEGFEKPSPRQASLIPQEMEGCDCSCADRNEEDGRAFHPNSIPG